MKQLIVLSFLSVILAQNSFAAQTFTCKAMYFNRDKVSVLLAGVIASSEKLNAVVLIVDGHQEFNNQSAKADPNYKPRKYVGYNQFSIDATTETGGTTSGYSILFPKTLGNDSNFIGYINETAADGGSYNRVFCELN